MRKSKKSKDFEGFLNITCLIIMFFCWEIPFYVSSILLGNFFLWNSIFLVLKNFFLSLTDNVTINMDDPLKEAKYHRNIWRESVTYVSLATLIHEINSQLPKWSLQVYITHTSDSSKITVSILTWPN